MISDSTLVFGLIAVAAALMASNRVRFDVVALLVLIALILSGVLTVEQSLAGFGSPVVILVAGLLVVGEMLARTGVAGAVGDWILRKGGTSEARLLVLIMVGSAVLGAVMSSTAIVAIFIPIILRVAAETGVSRSRLLLPMSYAALISGMLTLIATTPNIVDHEELKAAGDAGFGLFGFAAIGLAVLLVAIAYILLVGRHMLRGHPLAETEGPTQRSLLDLWRHHNADEEFVRARLESNSLLLGRSIGELNTEAGQRVHVIGLTREGRRGSYSIASDGTGQMQAGDVLGLVGTTEDLESFLRDHALTRLPRQGSAARRWFSELGGAAVLVHPESRLIGSTVRAAEFQDRYHLQVLGLRRGNEAVSAYLDEPLHRGDSLFVFGAWSEIRQLAQRNHDFVVLETPRELSDVVPARRLMPVAVLILVAMIVLTVFDIVPLTAAVLLAVLAAVFTRCLTMEDAYRSIHWSSIVLIAGMLPLADALNVTGATQMVVDQLMHFAGDAGPRAMLTILFFLTAGLGLVLSNTASAVLVAPIAIYAARALEVSPYPFAVAVLIAASAAYSTPVSTPVVTLVVEPGRYGFVDFLKLGIPLLLLTYVATMLVAPLVFPF